MALENEPQQPLHVLHFLGVQGRLPIEARVATSFEEPVSLPEGHLERFTDCQQGLAARLRAARLYEAHMPR